MNKINMKSVLEILSEKEMKNVMGGSGGFEWTDHGVGTCGFQACDSAGACVYGCNMTQSEAQKYANGGLFVGFYGNWCCDSCGSSSYCG